MKASLHPKVAYELQERCGKRAEEVFKGTYSYAVTYECHYNMKLNKCIMLIVTPGYKSLVDVNEHQEYGTIFYDHGRIEGRECKSVEECNSFVKKMMTE